MDLRKEEDGLSIIIVVILPLVPYATAHTPTYPTGSSLDVSIGFLARPRNGLMRIANRDQMVMTGKRHYNYCGFGAVPPTLSTVF
jgi:hypothetical protein